VWEWVVPSAELPAVRQRYLTSSAIHRSDGVHVRLVSEALPGRGAVAALPTLEDAYLHWISNSRRTVPQSGTAV